MTRARDLASGSGIEAGEVLPHIIPGVLYPAIAGKDLSGTALGGSYTYGTAHTDGRSYYYTDIQGSREIKDPRIGAHFGSQRHMCKSLQSLEQETATHGSKVYSVDGREWIRAYGRAKVQNGDNGHNIQLGNDGTAGLGYCEIVGYFTTANLLTFTWSSGQYCNYDYKIDGGSWSAEQTTFQTSANSPLGERYVDRGSVGTVVTGQTLGIHTLSLKIPDSGDTLDIYGIELIAQDTTSPATKSKIQIPSQNVVSYGKKFTVSGTPHYNPFDGMSGANSLSALGAYIDTATSLGMDNWKAGTANYYKPFNGGRVVRWVDSSGTIKTSVTMMPPNAQNIGTTASNAFSDGEVQAGTNDHTITFNTTAIDHSLSEVAKTFFAREFGNGNANGGVAGTNKDASMQDNTADDIAYVMDDGLTSLSGDDTGFATENGWIANNKSAYLTFIGTGITLINRGDGAGTYQIAQNLPYGTHIFKISKDGTADPTYTIDGVTVATNYDNDSNANFTEFTFYQPKMPPIPEDAVVLADYMMMADYVKNTTANTQHDKYISKGVRRVSCSRDILANKTANGWSLSIDVFQNTGFTLALDTTTGAADRLQARLPAFATQIEASGYGDRRQLYVDDGSAEAQTVTGASYDAQTIMDNAQVLGAYTFKSHSKLNTTGTLSSIDVVTPIHSSSHYQTFETPYLHELVGGDRNMEQTNLVVTPDGKTWDEVTRDTSYIGPSAGWNVSSELSYSNSNNSQIVFTLYRGGGWTDGTAAVDEKKAVFYTKDFAIAYDRMICLKDGTYLINFGSHESGGNIYLLINGEPVQAIHNSSGATYGSQIVKIKRGDYIQRQGGYIANDDDEWSLWSCIKIGD